MSQKTDDRIGWSLLILVALIFLGGGIYYFGFADSAISIDPVTNCPKDISEASVSTVLIDTTDPLSPVQAEFLKKDLDVRAESVPRFGELELFDVEPSSNQLISPVLDVCNPGNKSDTNQWTGNPTLMDRRWHDKFLNRVDLGVGKMLSPLPSTASSPIMEEIQQVAVEAFADRKVTNDQKSLVIVSDMIQNSPALNQYRETPTFKEFQRRPGYIRVKPMLDRVDVTILYVRRPTSARIQNRDHVIFWRLFFKDAGANVVEMRSING
jgi:hypothetical protein